MKRNLQTNMQNRDPAMAKKLLTLLRKMVHSPEPPVDIIDLQRGCIQSGISKRRVRTVVRNGYRGRLFHAVVNDDKEAAYRIINEALQCGVEDQFLWKSIVAMKTRKLKNDRESWRKILAKTTIPSPAQYVQ